MRQLFQKSILLAGLCLSFGVAVAQTNLPQDYLSPAFHKGRREAARALMPDSSVLVVFAAPTRNFSNDVDYQYHQNPDLYYFTGYKEPHAVLLLFKEAQTSGDGKRYNELFFVQKRDARAEQWNGRRLGVEGVKKQLGIESAYNGDDFKDFPLDLSRLRVIFRLPEGTVDEPNSTGDLYDLVSSFRQKAAIPSDYDDALYNDLSLFTGRATIENIDRIIANFKSRAEVKESYRTNKYVQWILGIKDSAALETVRVEINNARLTAGLFHSITGALREIKTPEEMELIRKAVEISCAGQNEVMKAVRPDMSELEIQGLHEFVHKKYGAEGVGYGSIIGAGENGCVLHYTENTKTKVGNEMLLMDVGAEYHGYTADVTRTIPADGKFSAEERAIYQLVYDAQEAAFALLKDGATWSDAGKAAKEVIATGLMKLSIIKKKEDVSKYYPHGLSHHIGLDVHDRGISQTLKKGMVITIEPGIYIASDSDCDRKWWGIAVRIEDDVLIREKDYELLSASAPRSVQAIEKLIAEKTVLDNYKLPPLKTAQKKAF
jgi:Xaa-Pro aminopeptidase